jgi:hypothetical protein
MSLLTLSTLPAARCGDVIRLPRYARRQRAPPPERRRGEAEMVPEINYWTVLLATLSSMAVGSIWYAPKVFGTRWASLRRST